ncbi:MAG TPA: putative ABC exporter domain-containing protein [Pirellulales bacterium]|jgi:hypothetical protein|nr:putative ABC exporter domain-containing protein [Pirellulales bacterium]
MHPGLRKLAWLLFRGDIRRLLRSARTVRGALMILLFAAGTCVVLGIGLLGRLAHETDELVQMRTLVGEYVAVSMFGGWLMAVLFTSGKYALAFRLAEVAMLFPAPVSRRQIIAYKLAEVAPNVLMLALMLSVIAAGLSGSWIATAVGLFLAIKFLYLSLVALALVRQVVTVQLYNWTRRLAIAALALIVAGSAGQAMLAGGGGWGEAVDAFRDTWIGAALLAPFELFCRVITADSFDLPTAGYAALAAAVDAGLVTAIMLLDAAYLEAAATASESLYQRLQNLRRGVWPPRVRAIARSRLRCPPPMGGVGPVAWWQLLHLVRSSPALLYASPVLLMIVATILLVHDTEHVRLVLCVVLSYLAFFESMGAALLPLGLRGDIDRLDVLKSLPLAPAAVVVGAILPSAMLLSLGQCLLFAGLAAIRGDLLAGAVAGGCFTLPVNLLLLGLNNLLFLVFPYRTADGAAGLANVQAHQLMVILLYLVIATGLAVLAIGGGFLGYIVGRSWVAFAIGAWLIACIEMAFVFVAACWTFHRFDVSLETPPE